MQTNAVDICRIKEIMVTKPLTRKEIQIQDSILGRTRTSANQALVGANYDVCTNLLDIFCKYLMQ